MNWKGCGRKQSWPNLRYNSIICLEGLTKTMKNLNQDSWSLGQYVNLGCPKYKVCLCFE
jgi:hypothetical protein